MERATDDGTEIPDVVGKNVTEIEQASSEQVNAKEKMSNADDIGKDDVAENIKQKEINDDIQRPMKEGEDIIKEKMPNEVEDNIQQNESTDNDLQETMVEDQKIIQAKMPGDGDENIQQKDDDLKEPMMEGQVINEEKLSSDNTNNGSGDQIKLKKAKMPDDGDDNIQQKDDLKEPTMERQAIIQEKLSTDNTNNGSGDQIKLKKVKNDGLQIPTMERQDIQEKMASDKNKDLDDKINQKRNSVPPMLERQDIQIKLDETNEEVGQKIQQKDKDDTQPPVQEHKDTQNLEMICDGDNIEPCSERKEKRGEDDSQQPVKRQDITEMYSEGTHTADEKSSMLGCQHIIQLYPDDTHNLSESSSMQKRQNIIQNGDNKFEEKDPLANSGQGEKVPPVVNGCNDPKNVAIDDISKNPSTRCYETSMSDTDSDDIEEVRQMEDCNDDYYSSSPTGTVVLDDSDDSSDYEKQKALVPLNLRKNQQIETIVLDDSSDDEQSIPENRTQGIQVQREFKIKNPPNALILDDNGKVIHESHVAVNVVEAAKYDLGHLKLPKTSWGSLVIGIHGLDKIPHAFTSKGREDWFYTLKMEITKLIKKELDKAISPLINGTHPRHANKQPWIPSQDWLKAEEERIRRREQMMWNTYYKDLVEDGTLGHSLQNFLKRSNPSFGDESPVGKKLKLADPLSLSPMNEWISKAGSSQMNKMAENKDKGMPEEYVQHRLLMKTKFNEEYVEINVDFSKIIDKNDPEQFYYL